jgi:hypothetical protein
MLEGACHSSFANTPYQAGASLLSLAENLR